MKEVVAWLDYEKPVGTNGVPVSAVDVNTFWVSLASAVHGTVQQMFFVQEERQKIDWSYIDFNRLREVERSFVEDCYGKSVKELSAKQYKWLRTIYDRFKKDKTKYDSRFDLED